MERKQSIENKLTIITGGSSGIGKAMVKGFVAAGSKVLFADKVMPEYTVEPAEFYKTDLTSKTDLQTFVHEVLSKGVPDILIFNAGQSIHQKLEEGEPEQWSEIVELNMMSVLRMIRSLVPEMRKKGGDVVFVSSVSAHHPYEYGAVYSATKAALENIAETLRLEAQPDIRVTMIAPGVVNTSLFNNNIGGTQSVESIGWGAVEPEEVADAVLYAVTRRKEIALNYMSIRPVAQPM